MARYLLFSSGECIPPAALIISAIEEYGCDLHIIHHDTASVSRDAIFAVFENIDSFKAHSTIARIVGSYILQRGCAIEKLETVMFAGFLCGSYRQVAARQAGLPEPDEKQQ